MSAPQVLVYRPSLGSPQQFASVFPGSLDLQPGTSGAITSVPGNGALPTWYDQLGLYLSQRPAALQGRGVIVNAMGSYLFAAEKPGFYTGGGGFDGEPQTVAEVIAQGYVWVDACAIPCTGRWIPSSIPTFSHWGYEAITPDFLTGGKGASELLGAMGFPVAAVESLPTATWPQPWAPTGTTAPDGSGTGLIINGGVQSQLGKPYPYPTSYTVNAQPPTDWPSNALFPGVYPTIQALPSAPFGAGAFEGFPLWAISMFGVLWGSGMYVYCNQNNGSGVTPNDAASFILAALATQSAITGPWTYANPPGKQTGGLTWWQDLLLLTAGLGVGVLAVDFGFHYLLARAGASETIVQVGPPSTRRQAG